MSGGHNFTGYYEPVRDEFDEELACVGRGTPCGEYMRRFWHPVAMTTQVKDLPVPIRRFGEDLILFRDKSGRYALVHRHCMHRNASLEFGIILERGIRCCYHGWHYDIDGTLLSAPAEEDDSRLCKQVRLGAYPVREYRGLLFTYMGPPDETPEFPIYDTFDIEDGELVPYEVTQPCNWLQIAENSVDPMHVVFLHTRVNIVQFTDKLGIIPTMDWNERPIGLFYTKARRVGNYIWISTNDVVLPNFTQAGCVFNNTDGTQPKYFGRSSFSRWVVPVDDTHTTILAYRHFNHRAEEAREEWRTPEALEKIDIAELKNRPYEERQRNPGDYEAFVGQGAISPHKQERLAKTDDGVIMYRRRLREEIRKVQAGETPLRPSEYSPNPIPTYGSDTVIHFPADPDGDDVKDVNALQKQVGAVYVSADSVLGEPRYDYLSEKLEKLGR